MKLKECCVKCFEALSFTTYTLVCVVFKTILMSVIDGRQNSLTHLLLLYLYSGADVTEPNSSDSRGERLDFFLKQEEALSTEPGFMGPNESEEAGGGTGGGTISSVANLKAALMSKNSLLSLRAEMMGDDNPLLYEYLPKGGHSLSCKLLFSNTVLILMVTHTYTQPPTHLIIT